MTDEEKEKNIVGNLCRVLDQANLTSKQIVIVLSQFIYSIGSSLEECNLKTSEEVLSRYAMKPTLGNALMAQAMLMKETWANDERNINELQEDI